MVKPKIVTPVIHFGNHDWKNYTSYLSDDFRYHHSKIMDLKQEFVKNKPLFLNGKLNPVYRNAVFILDQGFNEFDDLELLKQLPSNELLVNSDIPIDNLSKSILDLKGAFYFNNDIDPEKLMKDIQHYFYYDPDGYRLEPNDWHINQNVVLESYKNGNIYNEITLKPSESWTLLMAANNSTYLPAKMGDKISLDYQLDNQSELAMKVIQIDASSNKIVKSVFLKGKDLDQSYHILSEEKDTFFQILFYVKGFGKVKIGTVHIRRSRGSYGEMMPNDVIISDQKLHGNVGLYFDAGDLKPPLNVYFAGYRTKEGYEGRRMMQNFGSPFILISDWRLEGGAFYLGDQQFEQQIVEYIKATLKKLNFTNDDLILSGMSMGTFGALYYGAKLDPMGIVIGKPLAELGTIAQNGRVKRSNDFRTGEDIQLYFESDLSEKASLNLDNRFWNNLEKGTFNKTILSIAYMNQDDYNSTAYEKIRLRFNKLTKSGKLLSKGFEGRHNDQTGPVVEWFQRNYWHLLEKFNRRRPLKKKKRDK